MMRACQHENIAQLFGVFQDAGCWLTKQMKQHLGASGPVFRIAQILIALDDALAWVSGRARIQVR